MTKPTLSFLLNKWMNQSSKILREIEKYNKTLPDEESHKHVSRSKLSFKNYSADLAWTQLANANTNLRIALGNALVDELEEN